MRTREDNIKTTAHHLQKYNGVKNEDYPLYTIRQSEPNDIDLWGKDEEWFRISTTYLSDIHAILTLCHPDRQYCIEHDMNITDHYININVYSHGARPNILTYQRPNPKYNGRYFINTQHIDDISVPNNEPLHRAITRANDHAKAQLSFIEQYPHIHWDAHRLHTHYLIPDCRNITTKVTVQPHFRTGLSIEIHIDHYPHMIHIHPFIISYDQIPHLATLYPHHITNILPQITQEIQQYFPYSQHEKIHITRAIIAYFTTQHHHMLQNIQHCAEILRDNYVYIPAVSVGDSHAVT